MKKADHSGKRFGKLVAIRHVPQPKIYAWECLCDCGNMAVVATRNLTYGHTTSCGCHKAEIFGKKHGMCRSPEYKSWEGMRNRCSNPNERYAAYGGRGIRVCDRWQSSFDAFYEDMGPKPGPGYSLDRIDVNGDYEPGNCRWATITQQQRNRRDNIVRTYMGVTAPLSELCERFGMIYATVRNRIAAGASIEVAMRKGRLPRNTIVQGTGEGT